MGSVLGQLLSNIYIIDLLFLTESTNVCNYTDDTTFNASDLDLENLVKRLEHDLMLATKWSESNYMKLSGHKHEIIWANIRQAKIWESRNQKLLGIIIGRDLGFDVHVLSQ